MADFRQKWRQIQCAIHAIWSFFPIVFTTDQAQFWAHVRVPPPLVFLKNLKVFFQCFCCKSHINMTFRAIAVIYVRCLTNSGALFLAMGGLKRSRVVWEMLNNNFLTRWGWWADRDETTRNRCQGNTETYNFNLCLSTWLLLYTTTVRKILIIVLDGLKYSFCHETVCVDW